MSSDTMSLGRRDHVRVSEARFEEDCGRRVLHGGALTILSAVRLHEMDAGVCFYGIPELDAEQFRAIQIPLICHFANRMTGVLLKGECA